LGLAAEGDGLRVWNDTATDTNDTIASVDFGAATAGVSFNYDPVTGVFGTKSQVGVNGVFQADSSSDIGSPGAILAPAASPKLSPSIRADKIRIEFAAAVGRGYALYVRNSLNASDTWTPTGDTLTATNNQTLYFDKPLGGASRFYRVGVQ
jgi:hypothetical protein